MENAKNLRIIYMGTPDFAVMPLKSLVESGYDVVGVVTMPDKPAGRGLKLHESAVKQYAVSVGLEVLQPEKLRAPEFIDALRELRPDLGIVIAFRMLPEVVWSMPRLGTFNLHASLLPQYRGAAPINWAIMNGDTQTGVTTFMLNHEIDKGDILTQRSIEITNEDNIGTLHDKLMELGAKLVLESVDAVASGNIVPVEQDKIEVADLRPAPKIFKEDCLIDWNTSCDSIRNKIRGLSPYPAAFGKMISVDTEEISMKIYEVESEKTSHSEQVGTIICDGKKTLKVACKDGYININDLQLAGKKRMKTEDFLRGFSKIADYKFV